MSAPSDPMARWRAEVAATQAEVDAVAGEIREVETKRDALREKAAAGSMPMSELVHAALSADTRLELLRLRHDRVAAELKAKQAKRAEATAAVRRIKAERVLEHAAQAAARFDELLPQVAQAFATVVGLGAEMRQLGLMEAGAMRTAGGWVVSTAAEFNSTALRPLVDSCMALHDPHWRSDFVRPGVPTMTAYLEQRRAGLLEQAGAAAMAEPTPLPTPDGPAASVPPEPPTPPTPPAAAAVNGAAKEI